MSGERYIILGQTLTDLAEAVREKTGSEIDYTPLEMATAIRNLPTGGSILGTKNITLNGNYSASADGVDGYSSVSVNVPNSYAAADEGKVVNNGTLVAQTARSSEITTNGTYDTTLNDEVAVNVSGGGGGSVIYTETKIQASGVSSTLTLEQTIQIQHTGTYFISVVGYVDAAIFKINGTAQTLVNPTNYCYYYTNSSAQLQQGDSLYFYLSGTGRTIESVSVVML